MDTTVLPTRPSAAGRPTSHNARRIAASLLAGGLLVASSPASGAPVLPEGDEPIAHVRDARQPALPRVVAESVARGRRLFHDAGLVLPALDVEHHREVAAPCDGGVGSHRVVGSTHAIELCGERVSDVTVLHEMAHAWVEANVSSAQRATFRQLRGWAYWHDYDRAAWHDNGTEQAAEIVVWGVIDRVLPMVRIEQSSCDELTAGFVVLTGRRPALVAGHPCEGASAVVKVDLTASQRQAVDTAVEWYAETGFELPAVVVRGGGRDTLCKGHSGLYVWGAGLPEVRICTKGGSWEQRVVLHELAHAWSYANVPAGRRDAFVAQRGLEHWHETDDAWERRGDEHAAEIIAWGVSEIPFPVVGIDDRSCAGMRTGFLILTGVEPRPQNGPRCPPSAADAHAP